MRLIIIVSAIIVIPSLLFCQDAKSGKLEIQLDNGLASFQTVYEVEGDKETLFGNAQQWLFETYKSGKSVLELSDKEQGVIIGNGLTNVLYYGRKKSEAGYFSYAIKLEFKEGKYRVTIDNIKYKRGGEMYFLKGGADFADDYPNNWPYLGKKHYKEQWDSMKAQALGEFNLIALNLYNFLTSNDDW
ncbi:DUF4468 domain-containing protein [Phaeodactylibacter sp.]|uniref:DUF4468 domain-containing protein n=1 Tax=Phaeodactylibacter sp. TaxID=1940289 RepID=UPI0025FD1BF9|nr:DUF4468 domain-containing protein [Phaeodactylibacter sp.]MCI4648889.1 DUF4468 domain-containing protein [Phaeodactylibacter sp.]MCI5089542.1 DUF4468 domain-containing protein [Phaeodactylibacter sp.]